MMKWSNKIVYCDKSISKISTRSLSKLKKLQLGAQKQKQQANSLLQKSQLRLKSFQRMESQHKNSLSFYMNKGKLDEINQSQIVNNSNGDSRKSLFQNIFTERKSDFFKQSIKNKKKQNQLNNKISILQAQDQQKNQFQTFLNENYDRVAIKKIVLIINNLKLIAKQLKKMVHNFKTQLNKNIERSVQQLKTDLNIFLKEHTMKLQLNFDQLNHFSKPIATRRTGVQDTTFTHQQAAHHNENKNQYTNIGPVNFKNKFRNDITNSKQQNSKFEITKKVKRTENNIPSNQNDSSSVKILTRSPARKRSKSRTFQRINSIMYNSQCDSQNQRYIRRQVDKSGSKSIKKIQERLISMRKILTKQSLQTKIVTSQQQQSVQNSQKKAT